MMSNNIKRSEFGLQGKPARKKLALRGEALESRTVLSVISPFVLAPHSDLTTLDRSFELASGDIVGRVDSPPGLLSGIFAGQTAPRNSHTAEFTETPGLMLSSDRPLAPPLDRIAEHISPASDQINIQVKEFAFSSGLSLMHIVVSPSPNQFIRSHYLVSTENTSSPPPSYVDAASPLGDASASPPHFAGNPFEGDASVFAFLQNRNNAERLPMEVQFALPPEPMHAAFSTASPGTAKASWIAESVKNIPLFSAHAKEGIAVPVDLVMEQFGSLKNTFSNNANNNSNFFSGYDSIPSSEDKTGHVAASRADLVTSVEGGFVELNTSAANSLQRYRQHDSRSPDYAEAGDEKDLANIESGLGDELLTDIGYDGLTTAQMEGSGTTSERSDMTTSEGTTVDSGDGAALACSSTEGGMIELNAVGISSLSNFTTDKASSIGVERSVQEIKEIQLDRGVGLFRAFELAAATVDDDNASDKATDAMKAAIPPSDAAVMPVSSSMPATENPVFSDGQSENRSARQTAVSTLVGIVPVLSVINAVHMEKEVADSEPGNWLLRLLSKMHRPR